VLRRGMLRTAGDSSVPPRTHAADRRPRRVLGGSAAAFVLASTLAACGGDSGAANVLTWYTNPDSGGQEEIAGRCTEASGGAYSIEVAQLPRESNQQREQLIRRLAAEDDSIDIMSLDTPFAPEFAEAGFLAPVPEDLASEIADASVASAVTSAEWNGEMVVVPFWANTQLLWFKKSVVEAAGLDMEQPVTWDQIVEAAQDQDTQIAAQGIRAEALMVWFNALIESAGGSIIEETADNPEDIQLGLDSEAAVRAAEVMSNVANSGQVSAAFSTSGEDANVTDFESGEAGFMVNWPFVWPRALAAVEAGTLEASVPEDYGWAIYPRVNEDDPAAPPIGGINLGVGAFSRDVDAAYEAVECIVSEENQAYYFTTNGNPAARAAVYDDPAVIEEFPQAPVIRESLELAAPRPQTVYYNEFTVSIQRTYHPPSSVDPGATGEQAAELIRAVLAGEQLL
jgi:multiple sugar transport system substrate-binding protein